MKQFCRFTIVNIMLIAAVFCLSTAANAGDDMGMMKVTKTKTAEVAKYITSLKSSDSSILDITVLVTGMDGDTKKIASTTAGEAGLSADPEDIDAIMDNKLVVIPEGDSLDVTVPMANKSGLSAALTGVTLSMKNGLTIDKAKAKAVALAKKVEAILTK